MDIIEEIKDFFKDNLELERFDTKDRFSLHISRKFVFYQAKLLSKPFVLAKTSKDFLFHEIKALYGTLKKKFDEPVALAIDDISTYNKRLFIGEGIPFVSDKNVFLPFLGMLLEHKNATAPEKNKKAKFTPSEQLVFLWMLYNPGKTFSQQDLVDKLHLQKMTASRAMERIGSLGMVVTSVDEKNGRKLIYEKLALKDIYLKGKGLLANPVGETIFVKEMPDAPFAKTGMTALAAQTMISDDKGASFAISKKYREKLMESAVPEEQGMNEFLSKVLVMKYDPMLFAQGGTTDPITTILTIEKKDERTERAIDELMEKYKWYTA